MHLTIVTQYFNIMRSLLRKAIKKAIKLKFHEFNMKKLLIKIQNLTSSFFGLTIEKSVRVINKNRISKRVKIIT